jgi:hypothetical protein
MWSAAFAKTTHLNTKWLLLKNQLPKSKKTLAAIGWILIVNRWGFGRSSSIDLMKRPVFRQKKLIPETDSGGSIAFSSEEGFKRLWVLLELEKLDRQKKYLQDELRKRKLWRKVLLERLNQLPERN